MTVRRRPSGVHLVMALMSLFLLYLSVPNIAPVLRAATADGAAGWFTPVRLACVHHPGHEQCTWMGGFQADSGAAPRADVALYGSDRESNRAGERTRAVDVGRPYQVYGPGGSREWVAIGLMLLAGVGLLAYATVSHVRPKTRPARPPAHDREPGLDEEPGPDERVARD
ncbi:hypothetical protein AB0G05_02235 [Nonomuraea wenchangensis]